MPTFQEIIEKDGVIKCQSNLIDFTQTGQTSFESSIEDLIAYLNLTYGGNHKFKRSKVYLVIKEFEHDLNHNLPTIAVNPAVVYDINVSSLFGINLQPNRIIEFSALINIIIEADLGVNITVPATGFTAFTGYIVVEGSFINIDL